MVRYKMNIDKIHIYTIDDLSCEEIGLIQFALDSYQHDVVMTDKTTERVQRLRDRFAECMRYL